MRAFFAADEECVALFDAENRLVAATPCARQLFTVKDADGKHIIELLPPDIIAIAQEAQQDPGNTTRHILQEKNIECRVLTDDNNTPAGLIIRKIVV